MEIAKIFLQSFNIKHNNTEQYTQLTQNEPEDMLHVVKYMLLRFVCPTNA